MNLKELTKEQKQYLGLGGLVVFGLVAGIVFGVKVSLSSIDKAKLEVLELEGKIKVAERSLAKQESVRAEFSETVVTLKEYLKDAPPNQNYYSWATEVIYSIARQVRLDVDAIDEQSQPGGKEPDGAQELALESYTLRVTAHGGYESLKAFLRLVDETHPLARVIAVDISTGAAPEIHDMQLTIQWPYNLHTVAEAWDEIDANQLVGEGTDGADVQNAVTKKMPTPPPPRPGSVSNPSTPVKE